MNQIGRNLPLQAATSEKTPRTAPYQARNTDFSEMLQDKQRSIKVSHHAQKAADGSRINTSRNRL